MDNFRPLENSSITSVEDLLSELESEGFAVICPSEPLRNKDQEQLKLDIQILIQ